MLKKQLSRVKKAELSPQLSALKSQLSALSSQLSSLNSQLSALSPQLSALSSQPSTLNYQLSTLIPQLSTINSQPSTLSPQVSFKKVSTSASCKPDFVRRPPKRLAVRSFIYPAEAKFPPKRDATYPES